MSRAVLCYGEGVPAPEKPYHHGNLREAMIAIGVELAQEGGLDSIEIREVARRAGVSPAAAYRHFDGHEDLVNQIREHTLECLGRSMKDSERRLPPDSGPRDRLLALGRGYFDFAVNSPLLFELVDDLQPLSISDIEWRRPHLREREDHDPAERAILPPFWHLMDYTYELIGDDPHLPHGVLGTMGSGFDSPAEQVLHERVFSAATMLWATVQGFCVMIAQGPLRGLSYEQRRLLLEYGMNAALRGISGPSVTDRPAAPRG